MSFFCNLPFTEILSLDGEHAIPCCVFKTTKLIPVESYKNNKQIFEVKKQLLQGQQPVQCQACVNDEKSSGTSFRTISEKFRSDVSEKIKQTNSPDHWEIKNVTILTSNVCNLKCLPCSRASYVRDVELQKLKLSTHIPIATRNKELDYLIDLPFEKLTLLGGEPFYDGVTFDTLEKLVRTGRSKNILLDLNTNMTFVTRERLAFLNKNFKSVTLKASIDGIGEVNDYLRYPSNWSTIAANITLANSFNHIDVIITTALSNLSLIKFYQVIEWAAEHNFNLFVTPVSSPAVLRAPLLPTALKAQLLPIYLELKERLGGKVRDRTEHCIDTCINLCSNSNEDTEDFAEFLNWINLHDQHRGNSLLQVFPELIDYTV